MSNRIAFIDARVENYQSLIDGLPTDTAVVIFNPIEDGLAQILASLQGLQDINAIDILSHGAPGTITLGGTVLNNNNLADYAATLAEIGSHLSDIGDILLYGCDVASGDAGQAFMQQLADLTGADVAASTDLTGSVALGGDWDLEAQTGTIEVATFQPVYDGVLDFFPGTSGDDVIDGTVGDDSIYGNEGSDTLNGGDGNDYIVDYKFYDNGINDTNFLNGGAGDDSFYFLGNAGDSAFVTAGDGRDTYSLDPNSNGLLVATDFEAGDNGDVLDIYQLMYASNPNYNWGDPIDGYLRIYQRGTGANAETWLQWDADGSSGVNGWKDIIRLENGGVAVNPASLTYSNFSTYQIPTISLQGSTPTVSHPIIKPLGSLFDQSFEFTLPADTFSDPDGDPLSFSASLNGTPLNYDAATGIFSGLAPTATGLYNIEVTATDTNGHSVTTEQPFLVVDLSNLGSPGADYFEGTGGNDIFIGLNGSDSIYGYDGDDILVGDGDPQSNLDYDYTIAGGSGNDILVAGDGGATLNGGEGSDILLGGAGSDYLIDDFNQPGDIDTIIGGDGSDTIVYASFGGSATVTGGAGSDYFVLSPYSTGDLKITDFSVGFGGDILDISELVYASGGYSGNPFDQFSGYLRLNQVNINTTLLEWNNGTDWVKVAELQGVHARDLTPDNFTSLYSGDTLYVIDHPPILTPLPEHQLAGVEIFYSYTIPDGTFTDVDGDTLSYGVELIDEFGNSAPLPSWLLFDADTQTLSGTPTSSELSGTPLTIRITASDGNSSVSDDIQLLVVVAAGTPNNDNITGSVGDDNILGLGGGDTIYGFGGDDVLYGDGDGNSSYADWDQIYGGDGNDTIYGSNNYYSRNYLYGEDGDDVIVGGSGVDQIEGGAGSDTLFGGSGNDIFYEQSGDDGINVINGGSGNDSIYYSGSFGGSATITGGAGSDIYWLSSWSGGELIATDFQTGINGDVLQIGEILDYNLYGYDGTNNPFTAGYLRLFQDGTDTLLQFNYDPASNPPEYDWSWNTVIRLQNVSADTLTQENFGPQVNPTGGATQAVNVVGTTQDDQIFGSIANDNIDGGGSGNWSDGLYGYAGDDTIVANGNSWNYSYSANIYGGLGNDILSAGYSTYTYIYGEQGNDTIIGGESTDYLSGGAGSDHISGDGGDDYLSDYDDVAGDLTTMDGGDGNDTFYYSSVGGLAEIIGGNGVDTYRLQSYSSGTLKSLDFATGAGGDVLNLESLLYTSNWTELQGNPFAAGAYNYLRLVDDGTGGTALEWDRDGSGTGYDWQQAIDLVNVAWNNGNHGITIDNFAPKAQPDGSSGGISLTGTPYIDSNNRGGDSLYGSIGDDLIDGAGGYYDNIYGYGGNDVLYGDRYGATPANIFSWHYIYGGSGNDTLWAGLRGGSLSGGEGDDVLHGSDYRDYLYGDAGNDTIYAGAGDDYISTGAGIAGELDVIYAGDGNDEIHLSGPATVTVTGGSGADSYYLSSYDAGLVTITDFEGYLSGTGGPSTATGDVLNIDSLLQASIGYSSGDPFAAGYLDWAVGPGYIELQWDQDGAGSLYTAKAVARLLGVQEVDLAPGNYAPTIDGITIRSITVTDGYVAGADIYFDSNGNGIAEATEYSGQKTDANGNFNFTSTHTETIIAVGGTNIDTGLANLLTLKAPNGASTVNPLTTLVQNLVEGGATLAEATQAVGDTLDLPAVDILTYDPLAQTVGDPTALAVQKTIAQIAAVAVLSGNPSEAMDALTQAIQSNQAAGTTLDLTDANDLNDALGSSVAPETLTQIATVNQEFAGATDLTNLSELQGQNLDTAPNAAPELTGTAASLAAGLEDQPYIIYAADLFTGWSDPNGNTISVTGLTATNGSLVNNNDGTWTFTPDADFNGNVTLSYQVTDGALSKDASSSLFIEAVNDSPVNTVPGAQAVNANTPLIINSISVNDVDGNLASTQVSVNHGTLNVNLSGAAIISNGSNGSNTLTISGTQADINASLATLSYQATTDYSGDDTLTVVSNDTDAASDTDTVAITVNAVVNENHAPTAGNDSVDTDEDTAIINGQLPVANDEDSDPITYSLAAAAVNGTAVVNADGSYSYTPAESFNGNDSFDYSVSDGKGGSNTYTVSVAVAAVNDAPELTAAIASMANGSEDTDYTITLADLLTGYSDVDGDALAVDNLSANHGVLVDNNGTWTFTPESNYNGEITLNYAVIDGNGGSVDATQSFVLAAVNDLPEPSVSGADSIDEGAIYSLQISATDADSDTLSYSIDWGDGSAIETLTAQQLLDLSGVATHVFDDADGADNATAYSISVSVNDGQDSVTATQAVTVNNVAPTISLSGAGHVNEGALYALSLGAITDPGLDTVTSYSVDWGDGVSTSYTADQVSASGGIVTHTYANGAAKELISVGLSDEDGTFANAGSLEVEVFDLIKLGDAPTRLSSRNPTAWSDAWTQSGIDISHKADYGNVTESWSVIAKNTLSPSLLSGGDFYAGDLGVSGQNAATSSVKQEIDGLEALRFNLSFMAEEATINLSRFFAKDDGLAYNESGRLQAFNGNTLVGEMNFTADSSNGNKSISLFADQGFDSLVLTAGDYQDDQFVFGAYANSDGSFGAAPNTSHGSDFLVDLVVIGVPPLEIA